MSFWIAVIGAIMFAFLSGSLPFGYWAGKLKGIDVRQFGSGNIGATNVLRVMGKKYGIPVFILDMLKGLIPTVIAQKVAEGQGADVNVATLVAVFAAAASVLGHTYTPWLGGKGGKGVATTAGSLLGLDPVSLLIAFASWVVSFYTTRYVALASIIASMVLPLVMVTKMAYTGQWNYVLLAFGGIMAVLVVLRHKSNIQRLLAGTENRFEKKKK